MLFFYEFLNFIQFLSEAGERKQEPSHIQGLQIVRIEVEAEESPAESACKMY